MEQDLGEQEAGARHSGCLVKYQDHLALDLAEDLAEVVVEVSEDGGLILISTPIYPLIREWDTVIPILEQDMATPIMEQDMLHHTELVFLQDKFLQKRNLRCCRIMPKPSSKRWRRSTKGSQN